MNKRKVKHHRNSDTKTANHTRTTALERPVMNYLGGGGGANLIKDKEKHEKKHTHEPPPPKKKQKQTNKQTNNLLSWNECSIAYLLLLNTYTLQQ